VLPDALIVGAGPTGLLLAAELARHGIKPRLIDKNPHPSKTSKALAVFARTLEVFDRLGIADEAVKRGRKLHALNVYADSKRIVRINFDKLDSCFPFALSLPQSDTEDILAHLVENLGVRIERSVTFSSLEQDNDGVTATLSHADGREERCRVSWLIGCDGAHSTVRQAAGLAYQGVDLEASFLLMDVEIDWNLSPHEPHIFLTSNGELAAFPLPEDRFWRLIVDVPSERELPEEINLPLLQQLFNERSHLQANLTNPAWTSSFTIRQRMVDKSRIGRVFVAGDALSSHSPVGGQGMNTGLQDAYNLAWKLALAIKGGASTDLLNSYPIEREPVSKLILASTELATRTVTLSNPIHKQIRRYVAGFLTSFDSVQKSIVNTVSGLKVNYRKSPLVQEEYSFLLPNSYPKKLNLIDWWHFRHGLKAGDRAPDIMVQTKDGKQSLYHVLSGVKHHLLLFAGQVTNPDNYARLSQIAEEVERKFGEYIAVHIAIWETNIPEELHQHSSVIFDGQGECHQRYSAFVESFYLIRPDSYIGYRCQPADVSKLTTYLQTVNLFQKEGIPALSNL
jgi:2-polyprenyl-6-methoxyphenol hydroxylase-like FAD-dependent oxidoreductase